MHPQSSPARRSPLRRPTGRAPESLIEQGRALLKEEDETGAQELFTEALRLDPTNLHCHYLSAVCALLSGDEETLEKTCAHALSLARRHPYTIACEGIRYLYLANYERAETLLEHALRALPDNLDLYLGLTILYEYSGNREKGIDVCQRVLGLDPENVKAHVLLGSFYAMEGEFEAALIEYEQAKKLAPQLENPRMRLGRDYYYNGFLEQALAEFGRAVDEEPDKPAPYFYLLECLRRLGRTDEALDTYEDIKNRFSTKPEITAGLFEHFQMRQEAVAALEQLCRKRPNDPELLFRLSAAYRDADRIEEALATAQKLVRHAPEDPDALALLADLHYRAEQYRPAADVARRAIQLDPNVQSAYLILADSLLLLGRQNESYEAVRQMETVRKQAWENYQARFSGQDRADAGL